MRMWEPGDPIEGGNDTGIPDIPYFEYLRDGPYEYDMNESGKSVEYEESDYDVFGEKKSLTTEIIEMAEREFSQGNYKKALEYYNQVLDMAYNEKASCGKAECLHRLGNDEEASQIYFSLADRYTWGSGNENIAVKYYKRSIEFNPNNEDSLDNLGYVLRELERYEEALKYLRRVKRKDVDREMSICYMGLKRYGEAIPLLDKLIKDNPHRDDFLDEKCECLIGLGRKSEAIESWKNFIDFLMEKECYERALDRLDLLSKEIPNDKFIIDRRSRCLKDKESLDIRFKSIAEIMSNYRMHNPHGLDENDLYGFIKFVCEESGESVDDIVRWYNTPMLGSSSFRAVCLERLLYTHWEKIVDMYEKGKFRGVTK